MVASAIPLFHFKSLSSNPGIKHFVTHRKGGVSRGDYASLNLGLGTDDNPESVQLNRQLLARAIQVDPDHFVFARQVHKGNVMVIGEGDKGRGFYSMNDALPDCDAMITGVRGICLVIMVADCVPILIHDPVKRVVAVAHAGWRGTVTSIAMHTVKAMQQAFGCNPAHMHAGIGPSIGPCCYEVGREVEVALESQPFDQTSFLYKEPSGRTILDLWEANRQQLLAAGLPETRIELAGICTLCNHETFFSSRAGKGITGRFVAGICLME
jgi:YfiH family protein